MSAPTPSGAWSVVGAAEAVRVLDRMLALDRVPHALLLAGPQGAGKSRVARGLAEALNCQADGARPCGACRSCERIAGGKHADVEVVAPGGLCRVADHDHSRSRVIGICQVRRLETLAAMQPFEGRRRVFIVDPADALTSEAADAFLKTLEEPPPAVTIVLVSSAPNLLAETVRSRCRTLTVAPLPVPDLAAWLQREHGLDDEAARGLARLCAGRVGRALAAVADGDPLALRRAQAEAVRGLAAAGRAERFAYSERLAGRAGDPGNAFTALSEWIAWWRDLLLAGAGAEAYLAHSDAAAEVRAEARRYRPADVVRFLAALQSTVELLHQGVNARVALDALMVQVPAPRVPASVAHTVTAAVEE